MITPIIMESSIEEVKGKVARLRDDHAERVHIDIGDGLFSELLSIAPADLQEVELGGLVLDLHLLVDDPTEYIEECVALSPQRLMAQIERMGSQVRYLETVKGYGVKAGLALRLETPITAIEEEALALAEAIILLEIPPGTTGEPFDRRVLSKITELRAKYQGRIIADGGINPETYQLVMQAGADEAGANSWYWTQRASA